MNLIRRANKQYFALIKYKRAGIPKEKLKEVYVSIMRSVLEYSSNVYHSQLNRHLTDLLERMPKRVLRLIYGYEKLYVDLLQKSQLGSLEQRREKNLVKFAQKTLINPKYEPRWFPERELIRRNRNTTPYIEETATGSRLYKSPVYTMRRILNGNHTNEEIDLSGLFTTL